MSAGWLESVGIRTRGDLEAVGPLEAWRRVSSTRAGANRNLLHALHAALLDIPFQEVPPELREAWNREADGPGGRP